MTKRTLSLSGGHGNYEVALDGHDLTGGLRSLTIDVNPRNDGPQVVAELRIDAIEVTSLSVKDSSFEVSMPAEARDALIALGWTPPEAVNKIRDLRNTQGQNGTWNASGYMRGLHNGLELALSILEGERDPHYKEAPAEDGYLCDRLTPDMSGPEFEPVSNDGTPPAGDR